MSSTPRTSTDPHSVAGERADDEKTVREELESPDRPFSEEKDIEAAKDESISRAGSVAISPAEQDAGLDPDYDNFSDKQTRNFLREHQDTLVSFYPVSSPCCACADITFPL